MSISLETKLLLHFFTRKQFAFSVEKFSQLNSNFHAYIKLKQHYIDYLFRHLHFPFFEYMSTFTANNKKYNALHSRIATCLSCLSCCCWSYHITRFIQFLKFNFRFNFIRFYLYINPIHPWGHRIKIHIRKHENLK